MTPFSDILIATGFSGESLQQSVHSFQRVCHHTSHLEPFKPKSGGVVLFQEDTAVQLISCAKDKGTMPARDHRVYVHSFPSPTLSENGNTPMRKQVSFALALSLVPRVAIKPFKAATRVDGDRSQLAPSIERVQVEI